MTPGRSQKRRSTNSTPLSFASSEDVLGGAALHVELLLRRCERWPREPDAGLACSKSCAAASRLAAGRSSSQGRCLDCYRACEHRPRRRALRPWDRRVTHLPHLSDMQAQTDYVLRTVEERGVRFVRLWFTDVLGFLKSFAITPAELETALEEGMTFDGSAIEGYSRVQESDMLAVPDANTFEIVPWQRQRRADRPHLLRRPAALRRAVRGRPAVRAEAQPRARPGEGVHVLRRARRWSSSTSEAPTVPPMPLDHAGFFDLTQQDMVSNLRKQTIIMLEAMGIPVEYSFHELGPSQHEIDLRYTDALTMADNVMTFRLVVKEVAQDLGVYATFMPKPLARLASARGCTRTSRSSRATSTRSTIPATSTASRRSGSASSRGSSATRARSPRSPTSGSTPTSDSTSATRRPAYVCWARNNRSALVRVPDPEEGQGELDPHRVPVARPGVQPLPRVLGDARRGPPGRRGGLRPRTRGDEQHLRDDTRGARGRGHRSAAAVAGRGDRRDGGVGARRRGAR